ncbi:hypothetical protein ACSNOK_15575 [Streptomyces sp. URMC 126]|uniref:hypothetical protein n=1 Tax=Streptomyces sp. URMC 126 TaxID=3423401 RepID=UPI003F1B2388
MPGNLWIGAPDSESGLREITQAARSWDRSADLGVTEFRSLDGVVTLDRNRFTPRRLKLSWDWLEPEDARHLDMLARRLVRRGGWSNARESLPIAVIDPAAGNVLGGLQAAGECGSSEAEQAWFVVSGEVKVNEISATFKTPDSALGWRHGTWPGWPVAPGMTISWALPPYWRHIVGGATVARLDWKRYDGTSLASTQAEGLSVTGTVPPGASYVTPVGVAGAAGAWVGMKDACLTVNGTAVTGTPGDGCPAMAVTGYTDTPAVRLPYRNVSLDLVEVNGAVR